MRPSRQIVSLPISYWRPKADEAQSAGDHQRRLASRDLAAISGGHDFLLQASNQGAGIEQRDAGAAAVGYQDLFRFPSGTVVQA
jgi:hypothetical protein